MHVTREIELDIELSAKDRAAIEFLLDKKCEVEKLAKLTVIAKIELQDKKPSTESRTQS